MMFHFEIYSPDNVYSSIIIIIFLSSKFNGCTNDYTNKVQNPH